MSYLTETLNVPLWFLVFAFASAAPLWVKWYQLFYKKFIVSNDVVVLGAILVAVIPR